jgi:NAD(P)-dependent dehydrogenase (short-subunit alcohol dehydrogenase family)/acyl carrier protein
LDLQCAERPFREKGVYLISGGTGGIAQLIARHLAPWKPKLALLGRTEMPARNLWDRWIDEHEPEDRVSGVIQTVRQVEEAGAEVFLVTADVAVEEAMRAAVKRILDRFGTIHGVIHTAGITSGDSVFQPVGKLTKEAVRAQFRPKVLGAYTLERVLESVHPDFVLLFSSNAATLGGLGLAAYTAANHFLDTFAESRSKASHKTVWISAGWDQWPEETKHYKGYRTSLDRYAMTRSESLLAFERVATHAPPGRMIVSTGDLAPRYERWQGRSDMAKPATEGGMSSDETTHDNIVASNDVERVVADLWRSILGIKTLGVHDNFFELGGDSLMATRITARINDTFSIELPLATLFEKPTVAKLAIAVEALLEAVVR